MTDARRRLPDFIGIGALKAGTTYLDALLRTHPDICMPTVLKEVQFFTQHYERGPDWYADQFDCGATAMRGEISPQYLVHPLAPERMAKMLPDARLVLSVREPIERTYSQYKHYIRDTAYRGDFEAFLSDHPSALQRSQYWSMLQRYLEHYPADRIFVVVFEDLVSSGADLSGLFRFLGVSDAHVPSVAAEPVNVSERPRMPRLYSRSKAVSRWLYDHGYARVVHAVKNSPLMALYSSDRKGKEFAAPLLPSTAERLTDVFAEEVRGLTTYLGRDLSGAWPRFAEAAKPDTVR